MNLAVGGLGPSRGIALFATLAIMLCGGLAASPAAAPSPQGDGSSPVNINAATVEQLTLLPRVGAVVAERIVQFRDKNGRFKKAEDLLLVSGIGDRTFDLIKPYVSLDGETTLRDKVPSSSGGSRS